MKLSTLWTFTGILGCIIGSDPTTIRLSVLMLLIGLLASEENGLSFRLKKKTIIAAYLGKTCFWFRLLGVGFQIKNTPMLFSEREGGTKTYRLLFGWRFRFLTTKD